ncbi:MAG: ParB/RepB/Spo0J family partition protein [Bacteroidota bacterium]
MSTKRNALGKGLSALLDNAETDITTRNDGTGQVAAGSVSAIPVSQIETNPFQPRTDFDQSALQELASSIKEQGIIQPITVRKLGYDKYQIISGERRFRASKLAGLEAIPAYIRVANDQSMLEMALVENLQRNDLNAVEIGVSFKRLIDECSLTQEELSEKIGMNRSTVTNYIRLLKLPPEIQLAIRDNTISMGHARAILGITDVTKQLLIFKLTLEKNLSVREVEDLARETGNKSTQKSKVAAGNSKLGFEYEKIQNVLSSHFGTKIHLKRNAKGDGSIVIPFENDTDLNRILELLNY